MFDPDQITYFGETDSRGKRVRFGIRAIDRTKHMYVIGKSGMGKSTMLENLAVQDIQNGNGFCFLDPHGGSAEVLMSYIPEERKKDVLYIAPFDTENPIGFNILENIGADKRHLVVSGIMSVFKKLWADQWSARMEYFLQNTLFALLEYPGATLLHVNRMYSDKEFRDEVIKHITDPAILDFWTNEWAAMTERFIAEATPAIQNKIGQFAANPVLRNILGQPKSTFDFRELMDEQKIVIVNLSKGLIGEANADLIGSMVVTKLYLAAMSRADVGKYEMENLPNFYLYVDEFQSFSNESFANILSEARKYKLNLTIAHQYIEQMEETVRAAVFGNVGTTITFRVGAVDGEILEKEFAPVFNQEDIVNLGKYQIYLKLMIDGVGSVPFSSTTLLPLPKPEVDLTDEVVELSRKRYATSKTLVEENMKEAVFFDSKKKFGTKNVNGGNTGNSNKNSQNKNSKNNNKSQDNKQTRDVGTPKKDTPPHPQKNKKNRHPEQPHVPALREESQDGNPFKQALNNPVFTKSMTDKIKQGREEELKQKKQTSIEKEKKKYSQVKTMRPEHKNDLQAALAALVPKKQGEEITENDAQSRQAGTSQEGKKMNAHNNSTQEKSSEKYSGNSSEKKPVNSQKRDDKEKVSEENSPTRRVKIPAHISDEQLQKMLKITNKDLEL